MRKILIDTRSSVQFLSRLPFSASASDQLPDFKRSAYTFPIAGLIIAIPSALILYLGPLAGLPVAIVSILAVAAMVILTGALHEDGLADTADGFWGGHDKQRKLDIMRDSTMGTYGVLALVICLSLRIALIIALLEVTDGPAAALLLLAAASVSRGAILQPWLQLPAARDAISNNTDNTDSHGKLTAGLSARYGSPDRQTLIYAMIAALPAMFILFQFAGLLATCVALVGLQAGVFLVKRTSMRHIGGHTGDTLGATQQISELGLLLGLVWTM